MRTYFLRMASFFVFGLFLLISWGHCSREIPNHEDGLVAESVGSSEHAQDSVASPEPFPENKTTADAAQTNDTVNNTEAPEANTEPNVVTDVATPHESFSELVTQDNSTTTEPTVDSGELPPLRDGTKVRVRHVVDGDTVYVYPVDGKNFPYYKIRLWGFNAPECYKGSSGCYKDQEYFGLQAFQTLQSWLEVPNLILTISCPIKGQTGQICSLDPYDRFLAYLLLPNGDNTSIKMLTAGLGWVYTIFYPPLLKELCQAEADAILNKRGMWTQGRAFVKTKMNVNTQDWYYHKTPNKTHDFICSDALGQSFATLAGE